MAFVNLQPSSSYPSIVIDTESIIFARMGNGSTNGNPTFYLYIRIKEQEAVFDVRYSSQAERDAMYDKLVTALV